MPYDPQRHHRRSVRLKGYDYTQPGAYFVTLCTRNRKCLFGGVVDGEMRLNGYGITWIVANDNHVGDEVGATRQVAPTRVAPTRIALTDNRPRGPARGLIGAMIGQFKSAVGKRVNTLHPTPGIPVWQRNYYEFPPNFPLAA